MSVQCGYAVHLIDSEVNSASTGDVLLQRKAPTAYPRADPMPPMESGF